MRKTVLIMALADINSNPRPNRMLNLLHKDYDVVVYSLAEKVVDPACAVIKISRRSRVVNLGIRIAKLLHLFFIPELFVKIPFRRATARIGKVDLVITHDLLLLPAAFSCEGNPPVLFDAREYYPKHFEERLIWKMTEQPYNSHLVKKYMQKCAKVFTVSPGLAKEYHDRHGVPCQLQLSLPEYHDIPVKFTGEKIRLIHHGNATRTRKIENMIEMAGYLDDRFELDLMLMPNEPEYLEELRQLCQSKPGVKIIDTVPYQQIVDFISGYDIGVFLLEPLTFNTRYALPNKLFEFIQARLMVAISPNPDMKTIVESDGIGVVAADYSPETLAACLNSLSREQIDAFKHNTDKVAMKYSHEHDRPMVLSVVQTLIGD